MPQSVKNTTVVCLGDSITKGNVSVNYVRMLQKTFGAAYTFLNHGVNADLAYNALQRLDALIAAKPDVITILIGTNDVLGSYSPLAAERYKKMKAIPQAPTKEWYVSNLRSIVRALQTKTNARVVLLSLPLVSEDQRHILYGRSIEYSAEIQKISAEFGVEYLALNERQQELYRAQKSSPSEELGDSPTLMTKAILQHYVLFQSWDSISRKYGFQLTIDHIHQNSRGAGMIAECITQFLLKNKGLEFKG